MFMRNRLARKMAAEMRGATCAGTQTSKAPTLSGPSVTNHYSVVPACNAAWSGLLHVIDFRHASHSSAGLRCVHNWKFKTMFRNLRPVSNVEFCMHRMQFKQCIMRKPI